MKNIMKNKCVRGAANFISIICDGASQLLRGTFQSKWVSERFGQWYEGRSRLDQWATSKIFLPRRVSI